MSKAITISIIDNVIPHENADKLEIAIIEGWECIVPKGQYKIGDRVMYFPPEVMIPEEVANKLGVAKYLKFKTVTSPTGETVSVGRTKNVKIRNIVSMGIVAQIPESLSQTPVGTECNDYYGAWEYEAPNETEAIGQEPSVKKTRSPKSEMAGPVPKVPLFPNVVNILKRHKAFVGQQVVATEKLHGSNVAIGYIGPVGKKFIVVNSRNNRRKIPVIKYRLLERLFVRGRNWCEEANRPTLYNILDKLYKSWSKTKISTYYPSWFAGRYSLELKFDYGTNFKDTVYTSPEIIKNDRYWGPVENWKLWEKLPQMAYNNDFILYGEVTGQFKGFDYGSPESKFYVFDVSVNGKMLSDDSMRNICFGNVMTVPLIYTGEYDLDKLKAMSQGNSILANHIREGIVVRMADGSGPRLKLLNPEYLVKRDAGLTPDCKDN